MMRGITLAATLIALSGCTVQPLYQGDGSVVARTVSNAGVVDLSRISISPARDRTTQDVRNHLIFLFSGGAGEPAQADYDLAISARTSRTSAAAIQRSREQEPTSAVSTVTVQYSLRDRDGRVVAEGRTSSRAAFDVSRQQFAARRAQQDAQDRAAREAAEAVRLSLIRDLNRTGS
ncbi:MAG: LPS assembly lipoprotein LptE [Aliihoeflea sp.]|jgi:LPS-assembly lipoprotein|uniref:LPS assembly lipoprotein LptE n=1 Tax=Aliihoeflea sp. TaxID=2608088 RepID=UPI0040340600